MARNSVNWALGRLLRAAQLIELRKGVKPVEDTRIKEAVSLLVEKPDLGDSQVSKRRHVYYNFLLRMYEVGFSFVILCAVGLGQSAVVNLKDEYRLELLSKIREKKSQLENPTLDQLQAQYRMPGSFRDSTCINAY